jgi:GTPase Era involved in 16S rRNA processing
MQTAQIDKTELKNWIDSLDNEITLLLLQSFKEAESLEDWFWEKLSAERKNEIIGVLKRAKKDDEYSLKELWEEIKYQHTVELPPLSEDQQKALEESLRRGEEDVKAGRSYSSDEFWAEIERRRKQRA